MIRKEFRTGGEIAMFLESVADSFYCELNYIVDFKGASPEYCTEKIGGLINKLQRLKEYIDIVARYQRRHPDIIRQCRANVEIKWGR